MPLYILDRWRVDQFLLHLLHDYQTICPVVVSWQDLEILGMITDRQEREWAEIGARARLEQLDSERNAILARYPNLRKPSPARRGPGGSQKGRKLSDAAKKRMSAGMRKYWAKRKAKSSI